MRTARRLLGLFPARQQCRCLETPRESRLLLQESRHRSSTHDLQLGHLRLVHVFPSPFHRHNQDPDAFATARPPAHLPLPPAAISEQKPHDLQLVVPGTSGASKGPAQSVEAKTGSSGPVGSTAGLAEVLKAHVAAQRWMQHRIWGALTKKQWPLFERLLSNYWRCGLNYDEVTYTLKLHGYILCHRQKPEKAFLVLEEMKAAGMHPAVIRLNEGIIISQMELQDIFCALPADAYQNLCRLAFHAAIKVQRQRRIRLRERLLATPPDKLFALTYRDVVALLDAQERALCFPDEALALVEADSWSETPSLEENPALLRAVNEALGLEASCEPAEVSEEIQDETGGCEDQAKLHLSIPELHDGLEDLDDPRTLQPDQYDAKEAASAKAGNRGSICYEEAPDVSKTASAEASHTGRQAARASSSCSDPALPSTGKSDLRRIQRFNKSTPACLVQFKPCPPC